MKIISPTLPKVNLLLYLANEEFFCYYRAMVKRNIVARQSARNKSIRTSTTGEIESARPSFAASNQASMSAPGRRFGFLPPLTKKTIIIGAVIIAIVAVGYFKKNWIVAATVNGSPIFNTEVIGRLNEQFRKQTLEQMINEKIVLDEARKRGVVVGESDIVARIGEIEAQVGGPEQLDGLLSQNKQDRTILHDQLKIQLTLDKMFASEASVSAEELDSFLTESSGQLVATEAAAQRKEAEDILRQQKLSKVFNENFPQLREQAKVQIF